MMRFFKEFGNWEPTSEHRIVILSEVLADDGKTYVTQQTKRVWVNTKTGRTKLCNTKGEYPYTYCHDLVLD